MNPVKKKSSLSNYALKIFLHMNDDPNVYVFALVAAKLYDKITIVLQFLLTNILV